jgi:hypothetical protein
MELHCPITPSWRGAQLKRQRDKFTFTLGIRWGGVDWIYLSQDRDK